MTDKTNGERIEELREQQAALAELIRQAAHSPKTFPRYETHWHLEGCARAITRVGIMAAAVAASYFLSNPNYMYLFCLLVFTKKPGGPRKAVREQLEEVNARLDILMNTPPQSNG